LLRRLRYITMDDLLNNREVNSMKKLNKHYSKIIPYYGERFGDSDKFERIITTQRHEYIDREKDKKNLNVLDLGCGPGLYLKHMNLIAKELHACDLSSLMITHAKKENKYVKFKIASAERLPYPDNCFDVIFCFNSFYHFENQKNALREISRVLKPDGVAYIEFYNGFHPFVILRRMLNIIISINSYGSFKLIAFCKKLSLTSQIEIMSFIECSSSVKKFLPSFLFNLLKQIENIKIPKLLFFRGMLICKKYEKQES